MRTWNSGLHDWIGQTMAENGYRYLVEPEGSILVELDLDTAPGMARLFSDPPPSQAQVRVPPRIFSENLCPGPLTLKYHLDRWFY